jgi:transcriptional regulator of acetoin/glycerol metabolism
MKICSAGLIAHCITPIDSNSGSLPAAARSLGISPSTLYRKRERWSDLAA